MSAMLWAFGLGVSAPLRRVLRDFVSPPRASPFCQTTQKEPKGLAPSSGSRFAGLPSLHRSFRGTRRRAIPGPTTLSRHPCRSTPETPIPLGLLKGRSGACGYFAGSLKEPRPEGILLFVGADLVRESFRAQGVSGVRGSRGDRVQNPAVSVLEAGLRGQGLGAPSLLREYAIARADYAQKSPALRRAFLQLRYSTGRRRCT